MAKAKTTKKASKVNAVEASAIAATKPTGAALDVPVVATPTPATLYVTDPEEEFIASDTLPSGELITNPEVQVKKALHYRLRPHPNIEGVGALSTEKRITKLRDKIGVAADHLADELVFAVSSRTKKDKEYIKGLTWSLGVLFDKLNTGNSDTISVKLPAKLLENVKLVIAMQVEKSTVRSLPSEQSLSAQDVIDVLPTQVSST